MPPSSIPKGAGQVETSISGKPSNMPGVYEHPGSKARLIVMPDAKSTAQQDALVRMGYVRVAEPPTRVELAQMQADQLKKDKELEAQGLAGALPAVPTQTFNGTATESLNDAQARASAAEAELAALKARQLEDAKAAEAAKSAPDVSSSEGEAADESPTDQSKTESEQ